MSTEFNLDLAFDVYQYIKDNPEKHSQETWEASVAGWGLCGTSRCIAGWTIHMFAKKNPSALPDLSKNAKIQEIKERYQDRYLDSSYYQHYWEDPDTGEQFHSDPFDSTYDGSMTGIYTYSDIAAHMLGIPIEVADRLFFDMSDERSLSALESLLREEVPESWFDEGDAPTFKELMAL